MQPKPSLPTWHDWACHCNDRLNRSNRRKAKHIIEFFLNCVKRWRMTRTSFGIKLVQGQDKEGENKCAKVWKQWLDLGSGGLDWFSGSIDASTGTGPVWRQHDWTWGGMCQPEFAGPSSWSWNQVCTQQDPSNDKLGLIALNGLSVRSPVGKASELVEEADTDEWHGHNHWRADLPSLFCPFQTIQGQLVGQAMLLICSKGKELTCRMTSVLLPRIWLSSCFTRVGSVGHSQFWGPQIGRSGACTMLESTLVWRCCCWFLSETQMWKLRMHSSICGGSESTEQSAAGAATSPSAAWHLHRDTFHWVDLSVVGAVSTETLEVCADVLQVGPLIVAVGALHKPTILRLGFCFCSVWTMGQNTLMSEIQSFHQATSSNAKLAASLATWCYC